MTAGSVRLVAGEAAGAGERMSERIAWWMCRDDAWWPVPGKEVIEDG
ncbi:hypothetical protein ACFPA8_12220 [Streptomyces ovatisporus]|uniref:Uncharacterized protein n=1 Tax=Streptomyces ovatisporus TaxID=1128682 RepID=A0ABV9A862_9ACTN